MKKHLSEKGFDYASFEAEALSGLMTGKPLVGKEGLLKGLMKHLVESALEGELDDHLEVKRSEGASNRRNGHGSKKVQTRVGEVTVNPPRDRDGSFEPRLVEKWGRELNCGLEEQVLELYSLGNSYEDIRAHLSGMYGVDLSKGQLSAITGRVWETVEKWRSRALKSFYSVVFLDAVHFKVREEGTVKDKAVYTVYGVDAEGDRDVLSLKIGAAEGSKEWGRVLENLRERGVQDVLFFCVDGLKGFKEAIWEVFPESAVQRCIVHMMRSSLRFVDEKDYKAVSKGLKAVYSADDEASAAACLDSFEQEWGAKYPEIGRSWRRDWMELTAFFGFNAAVKTLIYTTNAIEGLHRMMRKTTKTKAAFVSEKALAKLLYLTLDKKQKTWKKRVRNIKEIQRSLAREFGERFTKHLAN